MTRCKHKIAAAFCLSVGQPCKLRGQVGDETETEKLMSEVISHTEAGVN